MSDNDQTPEPTGPSNPDAEPTQQFEQAAPPASPYAGPSGPPPAGNPEATTPLWLNDTTVAPTAVATAERKPRRKAGLATAAVAATVVLAAAAGYGGAALFDNTHDTSSSGSIFSSSGSSSSKGTNAVAPSGSIQAVAADVLPSVVKIEVAGTSESGSGSGIILTADGTILTNNHVVEIAGKTGKIRVDFNDGSSASATILGTDPLTDTAVIKVDKTGLKPATIGSSDALAVGQGVVAIGSPYGLDSTVTSGIVSALNRPVNVGSDSNNNATVYPAIQTDAAINPGNSGGALVNMDGQVVGINASIRTASDSTTSDSGSIGLGFAIPIDEVKPIIEQMIKGETPTHARLGITVHDVGADTSSSGGSGGSQGQGGSGGSQGQGDGSGGFTFPFGGGQSQSPSQGESQSPSQGQSQTVSPFTLPGAQIKDVSSGSAGAKAGLKTGDIITKVDDHQIVGSDSLVATIRAYRPGDKVTLTYTRDDKEKTVTLTLDSDASSSKS
ncbi:trypsin-like peptidase domain-containing protein [Nocardioides sp.]|uniref:S1C family serine protease n=1 Tax=Nocardioides sp. TaxID=35761 RepID=UPI0026162989|nr:trypsin-like peptidase domain-containing protein [Nocardioides sp.]